MSEPAIVVEDATKRYRIYHRRHQTLKELIVTGSRGVWTDLWALRDVDLQVPAGQMLGVRMVIPSHYATFPILTGTPAALREELSKRGYDCEVIEMKPGETVE